ncbi:MAG TPA: hypothetical protein VHM90_16015, partial [Phycisphaerae bacterium]|nr:hypothetical protein [Phycisphaerae bacterium]
MAKRIKPPRPSRSSETPRGRQVRDPLTRLLLFCELMALGLVAASIYLKFPRELPRPDVPEATAGHFPTLLGKASFIAVHTRTPWVTLAVVSLVAAVVAYQSRRKPARSRIVALAPAVILLVVTLHAAGQGWLQSHGDLVFEHREGGNSERIQELPATMAGSGPGTSTA